jgi:hypothetical protein
MEVRMKFLISISVLIFSTFAFAGNCKVGNIKECAAFLKDLNKKDQGAEFNKSFEDICKENSKFRCIKKAVRGDVNEGMKNATEDYPKAYLYNVTIDDEQMIYILEAKK